MDAAAQKLPRRARVLVHLVGVSSQDPGSPVVQHDLHMHLFSSQALQHERAQTSESADSYTSR